MMLDRAVAERSGLCGSRDVDRHAVEDLGLGRGVAHAAAVATAVAQPRDRLERSTRQRFEPDAKTLLQTFDQCDGQCGGW
jgi:hypothetical protein